MPKKSFTAEAIIGKLGEADVLLSQGQALETIFRDLDINQQTYYDQLVTNGAFRPAQLTTLCGRCWLTCPMKQPQHRYALRKMILKLITTSPMNSAAKIPSSTPESHEQSG